MKMKCVGLYLKAFTQKCFPFFLQGEGFPVVPIQPVTWSWLQLFYLPPPLTSWQEVKVGEGWVLLRGLWKAGAVWTLSLSGRCLSWKAQLRPHEINCNCRLSGLSTFYSSFLCSADKKDPLRTCNTCSSGRMKGNLLFQECALQKYSFVPVNLLRSQLKTRKTFIQTSGMLLFPFNSARRKPF